MLEGWYNWELRYGVLAIVLPIQMKLILGSIWEKADHKTWLTS